MAAGHENDVFHHVRDFPLFELPFGKTLELPSIAGLQLTRFMVLQLVAFALCFLIFRGLAKRVAGGRRVRGGWWNFWEALAVFIRDEVVRPTIGAEHEHEEHDGDDHRHDAHGHHHAPDPITAGHAADKYVPFVWSCFFYVLICNLLGAFPWLGSPTGEINVTGALAATAMGASVFYGVSVFGTLGFLKNLCPTMELPVAMKVGMVPLIWAIEAFGFLIKHGVLAIRLFANIMAGHTVIAVILSFIAATAHSGVYYLVMPASVVGQLAIGMLELFVAFLQAYIFAFLATLFIGMSVHKH